MRSPSLIQCLGSRIRSRLGWWTSFSLSVPPAVQDAVVKQLSSLPMVYGGLGMTEIRCRMAGLMAELLPGDINGFLFPCGGSEANEVAVRLARRYTGRHKIMTHYRSYHGGTTGSIAATGDFRHTFGESGATGFVRAFNPTPSRFQWGADEASATATSLAALVPWKVKPELQMWASY